MKKIAAMVLAGVLAAVPVSTTGAAEFQDGADTQNFIWAAGEETSTDTDESKGVSANDSVVEGLDKPLVFYPNTYYKFNVTGAGTQNTNPVEGDVRWTPLYWSLSLKPQESDIHSPIFPAAFSTADTSCSFAPARIAPVITEASISAEVLFS